MHHWHWLSSAHDWGLFCFPEPTRHHHSASVTVSAVKFVCANTNLLRYLLTYLLTVSVITSPRYITITVLLILNKKLISRRDRRTLWGNSNYRLNHAVVVYTQFPRNVLLSHWGIVTHFRRIITWLINNCAL